MIKYLKAITFLFLFCSFSFLFSEETYQYRVSAYGGIGMSTAWGDYPSEYGTYPQLSFAPGLRINVNDLVVPGLIGSFDIAYLHSKYKSNAINKTDYFVDIYDYVNLNIMLGSEIGLFYVTGGFYTALEFHHKTYLTYNDQWTTDEKPGVDFGVVGEIGIQPLSFLTVGVQGRTNVTSITSKQDIKHLIVHGIIQFHILTN